eukprot:m.216790 g.216790  ORF g.216790 m.216790 type:complete len:252 (-) comp16984_c1_seq45:1949-2704(-)
MMADILPSLKATLKVETSKMTMQQRSRSSALLHRASSTHGMICSRHGKPPSNSCKKRPFRKKSSKKTGACPARLYVAISVDGRVLVEYFKVHNHAADIKHVHISENALRLTADLAKQGMSFTDIKLRFKEEFKGTREEFLAPHDIKNALKRFHPPYDNDDFRAILKMSATMKEIGDPRIRYLKLPASKRAAFTLDEDDEELEETRFILLYQSGAQIEYLKVRQLDSVHQHPHQYRRPTRAWTRHAGRTHRI